MNIQNVSIDALRPYWRNPRNVDEAVELVRASIEDVGYVSPIAVDKDMTIIAGHARYRALQRLGYTEIDVVVCDHLEPQQVTAYRIADNKSAELAEWDEGKLISEVTKLDDGKFVRQYFDDHEIGRMFPQFEEEVPEDPADSLPADGKGLANPEDDPEYSPKSVTTAGDPSEITVTSEDGEAESPNGEEKIRVTVLCPECGSDTPAYV